MAIPCRSLTGFLLFYLIGATSALIFSESLSPPVPKEISDMRDAIIKGLGFHGVEGLKISGFDVRDSLVGQSVAYEFDIEVDKKVLPFKLLEDANRWDLVDLPIFRPGAQSEDEERALTERDNRQDRVSAPVLPPFQLAGPMELWIQDADDMRLALPGAEDLEDNEGIYHLPNFKTSLEGLEDDKGIYHSPNFKISSLHTQLRELKIWKIMKEYIICRISKFHSKIWKMMKEYIILRISKFRLYTHN